MSIRRALIGLTAIGLTYSTVQAQNSERIRLNQVGYAFGHKKLAISLDTTSSVELVDSASGTTVFIPKVGPVKEYAYGIDIVDSTTRLIDFTAFNVRGTFFLKIGNALSHPVRISANPFEEIAKGSIKAFWYNRSSYALPDGFAGPWAREMGHPDEAVLIHPSAASVKRPAGTTIRSPGGWYDAGDYGKYIVNSGISTWTLLHLLEGTRAYADTLHLAVPSRTAPHSDLADEILWNLRWMLTMQDPEDGGVYHKLTTLNFNGFEMPSEDLKPRYVFQKSTAASLDLAAVAAYAARLFKDDPELKPLADSCLSAALSAWGWARANPNAIYNQDTINAHVTASQRVYTGTYADAGVKDELQWAAAELFLTTQADSFAIAASLSTKPFSAKWGTPNWGSVSTLGYLSLQANPDRLTGSLSGTAKRLDSMLLVSVRNIRDARSTSAYGIISGAYVWGSNSSFANNSLMLWKAWLASSDTSYRSAALDGLDYLLGRNATGYSFVTGFGSRTPMYPHHRPSGADGVEAPIPGFLVGGPNSSAYSDDKAYGYISTTIAPLQYTDEEASYASNEVAINWNAPLAYLTGVWSAYLTANPSLAITSNKTLRNGRSLRTSLQGGTLRASLPGQELSKLELLGTDGRILARTEGRSATLELSSQARGFFLVRAVATNGQSVSGSILIP